MSEEKYIRQEIKEILVYLFIGIFFVIILSIFGGLVLKGFEESFTSGKIEIGTYLGSFLIYTPFLIGSLFLIIFPIARLITIPEGTHPAEQTKPSWFTLLSVSLIHAPEEGALYKLFEGVGLTGKSNPMNWSKSIFRCFIIGIIIFGGIGILQISFPQLNVAGVPQPAQQLSATSDIIFGASVPAFSENGILLFILFLLLGLDAYICSKFNLGTTGFFIIALIILSPILSIIWANFHSIVYGNSEARFFATLIFGFVGTAVTILTGTFIFFFLWHFFNNLFIKLSSSIAIKEDLMLISIILWILLLVAYVAGEIYYQKFKSKRKSDF